jgi:hypothetical protein
MISVLSAITLMSQELHIAHKFINLATVQPAVTGIASGRHGCQIILGRNISVPGISLSQASHCTHRRSTAPLQKRLQGASQGKAADSEKKRR